MHFYIESKCSNVTNRKLADGTSKACQQYHREQGLLTSKINELANILYLKVFILPISVIRKLVSYENFYHCINNFNRGIAYLQRTPYIGSTEMQ